MASPRQLSHARHLKNLRHYISPHLTARRSPLSPPIIYSPFHFYSTRSLSAACSRYTSRGVSRGQYNGVSLPGLEEIKNVAGPISATPPLASRPFSRSHGDDSHPDPKEKLAPRSSASPLRTKILSTLKSSGRAPHEKIWNIPNVLTFSRLAAAPAVGYFILSSQPTLALSLFFYAGVTDLVDGYLARHLGQQTVVGTVIDPMADKALMTISVVALAMQGGIPVWLAGLILARDVGLAISAIYIRWISLPPPKTMSRYWDFSLPSAEVRPTNVSKANTFLQLLLVGAAMAWPVLPAGLVEVWHLAPAFDAFQYVVAVTTIWSGASYAYSKNAFKILSEDEIDTRLREKEKEKENVGQPRERAEKPSVRR